ncbi:MAG TPA: hypothetical protein ACFYEK_13765 [Candidatus Wunengus sp. YC60]|uniref:hypothetical protein n=1 Tax=Candidatus Wunengus sp. YC60 TaxID=3367697 RepID=UPI0040296CB3
MKQLRMHRALPNKIPRKNLSRYVYALPRFLSFLFSNTQSKGLSLRKQLRMHRALGGAPTLSVQWRSLLANTLRVRRGLASGKNSELAVPAASVRATTTKTLKTKFFRKEARPLCRNKQVK